MKAVLPGLWKHISKFTDHIEIHQNACVAKPKVLRVLNQGQILTALLSSFVSVPVSHKLVDGILHNSGPHLMEKISILLE
jgi:hypothetical protein